jgi:hypothetical protein
MTSYDRGEVVLATLPFSDLTGVKKRPAVVVSAPPVSIRLRPRWMGLAAIGIVNIVKTAMVRRLSFERL